MVSDTKAYVGNLNQKTKMEDLDQLFSRYGQIKKIEIKFGFGFIEYTDHKDAEDAISKLDGFLFMGNRLKVDYCKGPRPEGSRGPPRNLGQRLTCEGLPLGTGWQDVKDWARKAGNVTYVDTWDERDEAKAVIEYAHKVQHEPRGANRTATPSPMLRTLSG